MIGDNDTGKTTILRAIAKAEIQSEGIASNRIFYLYPEESLQWEPEAFNSSDNSSEIQNTTGTKSKSQDLNRLSHCYILLSAFGDVAQSKATQEKKERLRFLYKKQLFDPLTSEEENELRKLQQIFTSDASVEL